MQNLCGQCNSISIVRAARLLTRFRQIYRKRLCPIDALWGGFPPQRTDRNRAHNCQVVIACQSTFDPKPRIPFGAASHLAHENDMTSMPQFINPHRDMWAGGGPQLRLRLRLSRASKGAVRQQMWDQAPSPMKLIIHVA